MLYKVQKQYDQLDLGAYWNHDPFTLGLWFRGMPVISKESLEKIDAVIVLVGYKIAYISFGYSYDFTISKLISSTGGFHEIFLIYEFNQDAALKRKRKRVTISCPKF